VRSLCIFHRCFRSVTSAASRALRSMTWDWSSLRSCASLLIISSSFACGPRFAIVSSHRETLLTRRSRSSCSFAQVLTQASASAWASLVSSRRSQVDWSSLPMGTYSSLSTSSIASSCALFIAAFCFSDLVCTLSREPHSLRCCCSAPSSFHS
jgi:hypothetical protein